jgi:hypothetical protein
MRKAEHLQDRIRLPERKSASTRSDDHFVLHSILDGCYLLFAVGYLLFAGGRGLNVRCRQSVVNSWLLAIHWPWLQTGSQS